MEWKKHEHGKAQNDERGISCQIDLLSINKLRWSGMGHCQSSIYYPGHENQRSVVDFIVRSIARTILGSNVENIKEENAIS